MKVKKLDIFYNKSGLNGCKWPRLNGPGTEIPLDHPILKLSEFPFAFSLYWRSGLIRIGKSSEIDWYGVASGCVLSAGEVYGVGSLPGSLLVLAGLALYSPLLSLASFLGGAVGTVAALYFAAIPR